MHSGRVWSGDGFPAEVSITTGVCHILPCLLLKTMFLFRSIFYPLNIKRSLTSLELEREDIVHEISRHISSHKKKTCYAMIDNLIFFG